MGVGYTDFNWCLVIHKYSADMQSEEEMRESCDGLLGQGDAEEVSE